MSISEKVERARSTWGHLIFIDDPYYDQIRDMLNACSDEALVAMARSGISLVMPMAVTRCTRRGISL